MKRLLIAFIFIFGISAFVRPFSTRGQSESNGGNKDKTSQYTHLKMVLDRLSKKLETVPMEVKRVAPLKISYEESRITDQGFKLIKNELQRIISETGRLKVLDIEELEQNTVLKIIGTDSTLKISNASERATEKYSKQLAKLSETYSIDAYLKGHVQYDPEVGFIVTLEMINPRNKTVIWSTSVMSVPPKKEKKEIPGGLTNVFSAGANLIFPTFYESSLGRISSNLTMVDYNFSYTYRQPVNPEHSAYFGIRGGLHVYKLSYGGSASNINPESYNLTQFDTGLFFYKTLGKKEGRPREYWIELFIGPNMLISFHNKNFFGMTQGLHFNVSRNIGIGLGFRYLFESNPTLYNKDETKVVEANSTTYGLKLLLKF